VRTLLTTFAVIFIAELPDKTALATLVLAARYRARPIVLGACLAFLVQTIVAVGAGGLLRLLPEREVRLAAGAGFLVFAVLAWRRHDEEEQAREASARGPERPVWVRGFVAIFIAEWGDLTQLATAGLAAQERNPLAVGVGAVAALWLVCVLAAAVGTQAGRLLGERVLSRASAVVFAAIGCVGIVAALR
jgi:putative Ca2+/H+ antiporter (TMEM165/GDT1 family)